MKRGLIFTFSALFAMLVLVGCNKKTQGSKTTGSNGNTTTQQSGSGLNYGNLEDGLVENYAQKNEFVATREDTREDAYSVFNKSGSKIGDFKTIATAINAAVDYDVENEEFGSYVTKIGDTYKLFYNKEGYTDNNDDQFWFYENGNALESYFCWDDATHINSLRNTNYIVHNVSSFGTVSKQSWNSYGLLDSFGEKYDTISAQSWELSSTMDAAMMAFTYRRGGITKVEYNIDMSNVKIIPPYAGSDKTYAFMGYYAWQDYYVIAIGIACDTSTGNWYQFIGTSRDDSFSDVKYDTGACIMTSTWNEQGGYFTPDCESIKATIETVSNYDEEYDEYYQTDVTKWELSNGTTYTRVVTDSLVNSLFAGTTLGMENSYVFIAGLDIKNDVAVGSYSVNTDYFNGSSFENLTISSARCYVPTTEELDDVDYGYAINEEWRGQWHDLLLANYDDTDGLYDYVILNTNMCCEYTAINNKDVFSFSYNGKNVSQTSIGRKLAVYQAKVDALKEVTSDNSLLYNEQITEIGSWLLENANIVPAKYLNVLNLEPYYRALDILNSVSLSEEGEAVAESLKGLTANDYEAFKAIYDTTYNALSDEDKVAVRILFGASEFDAILEYAQFRMGLSDEIGNASLYKNWIFLYKGDNEYAVNSEKESLTAGEAAAELVRVVNMLVTGTKWTGDLGSLNDDPNNSKVRLMNGDNNFYPSLRIVMLVEYFKENNVALPSYITGRLTEIGYDSFYDEFYYPIYMVSAIASKISAGTVSSLADLSANELEFLNECWTGTYTIGDQISWNWLFGQKLMTYYDGRSAAITYLATGESSKPFYTYADALNAFLNGLGYTVNDNGWGVTQSKIGA